MSRHRSRSPLHSRTSTLLGRRDGYYGEQYHAPVRSDAWRGSENVDNRNMEGGSDARWDNGSSQTDEQVDHWAKFIEAIDRAEKQKASSLTRFQSQVGGQRFEENSAGSPKHFSMERFSSLDASRYGLEAHERVQSVGQRRNELDDAHVERHYASASPRHSQGKTHDRMKDGYNEEHEDRYERSSYSERSLKSDYTEHQLHFKGYQDLEPGVKYSVSHRGISPPCAPVIVEHGHGIIKHDVRIQNPNRDRERPRSRDPTVERGHSRNQDPSRDPERPRSRDAIRDREQPGHLRGRELSRNREPVSQREHLRSLDAGRDRYPRGNGPVRTQEYSRNEDALRISDLRRNRDYPRSSEPQRGRQSSRNKELHKNRRDYHLGASQDNRSGSANYHMRQDARSHTSLAERGSPLHGIRHHTEQTRMESPSIELHGQRPVGDQDFRMAERNRPSASDCDWDDRQLGGNHGSVLEQGTILTRNPQYMNPNHPRGRLDFAGHETLKIKVDMSRPVHQNSHLGYSSERQLSLDLVNVGRQRLDFLPMLEHSGTFRETAMHSGTFAQEIITLVHHVKENYFQGQGITLNERFCNEQDYSMVDDFADLEEEMEGMRPLQNGPLGSTQIFCNIGPLQSKPHIPAPGDLRHDLERKRQERLEGVKITIGNFSQIMPPSVAAYMDDEEPHEGGWSDEVPQQTEDWDEPHQKINSQNSNTRGDFKRIRKRQRPRMKRSSNNGARW